MDLLRRAKVSELKCKHIEFVLAVKSNGESYPLFPRFLIDINKCIDSILWLEDQLVAASEAGITVKVHVTQTGAPSLNKLKQNDNSENESSNGSIDVKGSLDVAPGRPNLPAIIHKACQSNSGTMAIAGRYLDPEPRGTTLKSPFSLWSRLFLV